MSSFGLRRSLRRALPDQSLLVDFCVARRLEDALASERLREVPQDDERRAFWHELLSTWRTEFQNAGATRRFLLHPGGTLRARLAYSNDLSR